MKRIILITLLILLITACTPEKELNIIKQKVNLTTEDEINIVSRFYPQKTNKGIILLHMLGKDKDSWGNFPMDLKNLGYNVISIDLRGHGESDLDINLLTEKDYQNMVKDVEVAHNYLEEKEIFDVSIIGASIGANTALNYAANKPKIQKIILISPSLDYKGVKTQESITKYKRPLLIITGKQDEYSKESSETLFSASPSQKELKIYDTQYHGTNIIKNIKSSKELIKEWLEK